MQLLQGIETVARLGVGHTLTGLDEKPEVGKAIGKGAALRSFHSVKVALTHNQRKGMFLVGAQEIIDMSGIMLSVAVEGDGI